MAKFAPDKPTTRELEAKYPQTNQQRERIFAMRKRVSDRLGGLSTGLLVVAGPCAMTLEEEIMRRESERMAALTNEDGSDILGLYRDPDWKPRTNPGDWHGLITSDPEAAYRILHDISGASANIALEMGYPGQLERDTPLTTLGWKGGRNDANGELTKMLALHDPTMPVAVKNGLSGEIDRALDDVETIEQLRGPMGARAILLYRGGFNAQTPQAWGDQYLEAHERTGGRLLVDIAHGGEQAFDPTGEFKKSKLGQAACLYRLIEIGRETGKTPVGIFIEASDMPRRVDPMIPFDLAIESAEFLAEIRRRNTDEDMHIKV